MAEAKNRPRRGGHVANRVCTFSGDPNEDSDTGAEVSGNVTQNGAHDNTRSGKAMKQGRTDLTFNNSDDDEDDQDVHYPCDNCKSDSCLLECERCYKWLCVKCQKVPKAMINALNKYEHLHWYCMSCEVAATKAAAESNMKCRKIKLAETSPDIKTIAEVAQKTADAILNEVQVKLNVQASPDESTKRSYSDVARNISRFTGTINKIVSNTTRSQNIDQNTVAEKKEVVELVDEYLEREKRRKNVVAFNIPEKTTTDQESDEKTFLNIMKDEFNLIPRIESVRRLGRPSNDKSRPLLIKIDDEGNSTRQLIIRRAKELRQSNAWNNIFIVPDQTPNERELGKKLREELKTRRSAGEINLTIRRSRIVSKSAVTENKTRANHGTIQPPQLLTQAIDQGEIVTAK